MQVMEYFVLLSSLLILYCGMMFAIPIEMFPSEGFRKAIDVIALVLAIASTIFVVGMSMLCACFKWTIPISHLWTVIWDANTRKKNDRKKLKLKKKQVAEMIEQRKQQGLPYDDLMKPKKTRYDQNGQVIFSTPFFDESTESDHEHNLTLNQILGDLLSVQRLKRKVFMINQTRKRIQGSIVRTTSRARSSFAKVKLNTTPKNEEPQNTNW